MKRHKIFETNPNLKEVHMTSDGESFYNDNDAKLHAKSLKDKSVELVANPSLLEVITEDEDAEDEQQIGEGSGEENIAVPAKADGSFNELIAEVVTPEVIAPEVVAPVIETPEVVVPEVAALEVVAPVVEIQKVTPKKTK
jgi:hypothetical protein